jgi:large subunit ribosomal protein L21e
MESFETGQRVHVTPISTRSMPHPRYRGKTGTIVGKQGVAYVVELMDSHARKRLIIEGAHLTRAK